VKLFTPWLYFLPLFYSYRSTVRCTLSSFLPFYSLPLEYKRGAWASGVGHGLTSSFLTVGVLSHCSSYSNQTWLTHTDIDFCYKNHVHTPQRLGTELSPSPICTPYYKSVLRTRASRTERRVLLSGGPKQYKSSCLFRTPSEAWHTIRESY
jgi:hypothetical protein